VKTLAIILTIAAACEWIAWYCDHQGGSYDYSGCIWQVEHTNGITINNAKP